jgi:2Fe-2S ferredoxin
MFEYLVIRVSRRSGSGKGSAGVVKVTFIEADGAGHTVAAPEGSTLMQAAISHAVPGVLAECGGACACATCHVYVRGDWRERLEPAAAFELEMLQGAIDPTERSRLACQIKLTAALDGLTVELPAAQI